MHAGDLDLAGPQRGHRREVAVVEGAVERLVGEQDRLLVARVDLPSPPRASRQYSVL
jgi:hypothetical protein